MFEVPKSAPQQAVKSLGDAFKRFFLGKSAHPRFKKKFVDDSFRADNGPGTFDVQGRYVRLPKIGWVKMRELLRFSARLKRVVVSRTPDRWFASVLVEMDTEQPDRQNHAIGGVDLGVKALATLPDGTAFESPKALEPNLKKQPEEERVEKQAQVRGETGPSAPADRRHPGGRAAQAHFRACPALRRHRDRGSQRVRDAAERSSRPSRLGCPGDVGMHEFRRQLDDKAELYGTKIVMANRFYAASKTCSACGCEERGAAAFGPGVDVPFVRQRRTTGMPTPRRTCSTSRPAGP